MTKARFSSKQPPVSVNAMEGMNWFTICLNEKKVSVINEMDEKAKPTTEYLYDFNEFHDDVTDPEDVKKNPDKYLDYQPVDNKPEPEKTVTLEKRLKNLEVNQEDMAQAVQDMLSAQMAEE